MRKKHVIAVIVILAILGISALIFFLPYLQTAPNAVIEVKKGTVEIYSGSGWNKASSGTELKQGYYVRTLSDGETNIIFSGNSVARLSNNTRVKIVELKVVGKLLQVRLNQSRGEVWHSISPVSGISSYIIETPIGDFTEVGTSFGISIGKKKVAVSNGLVAGINVPQFKQKLLLLPSGKEAIISLNIPLNIVPLQEDGWAQKNENADNNWLVKRREEIKKKYNIQISMAKLLGPKILNTEITEDKINDGIDRYLRGEIDVKGLTKQGKIPEQFIRLIPEEFLITNNEHGVAVLVNNLRNETRTDSYIRDLNDFLPDKQLSKTENDDYKFFGKKVSKSEEGAFRWLPLSSDLGEDLFWGDFPPLHYTEETPTTTPSLFITPEPTEDFDFPPLNYYPEDTSPPRDEDVM